MSNIHEENAKVFKALCDEKRLAILELLRDGEKCACNLTELTGIKQTALSYHMKVLTDSKIVSATQRGKWVHYSISKAGSLDALELLTKITTISDTNQIVDCCEEN